MKNHYVAVGGLVVNDKDEILLVKSPQRGWEFPGGIVESGESLVEALKREIVEESGVTVKVLGLVGIYKNTQMDTVNMDFHCRYESGILRTSEESIEVGWFMKENAIKMITYPLYIERFSNMLKNSDKIYCCAFKKDPLVFSEYLELEVGL